MNYNLTTLSIDKFKVLKVIRVLDNLAWNPFSGYLFYTRNLTREYSSKTEDYLDEIILESICKVFPESHLIINKDIIFQGLLDNILQSYSGKSDLDFKISFIPNIPYDKMDRIKEMKICNPTISFNFHRTSLNEGEKLKMINTHIQAEIPFDNAEEFCKRVKSIDPKI